MNWRWLLIVPVMAVVAAIAVYLMIAYDMSRGLLN